MGSFYRKTAQLFILIVIFLTTFQPAFASTYGSGTYGSSLYGGATPTPQESSSNNSQSNSSGVSTCSSISPIFAPDLYQINSLSTQSTLYFAPIYGEYSGYIIDYGYDTNTEQFSAILNTNFSSGAIQFQVNLLNPNTTYSFKVRALNNCVAGPWSNIITIKTSSKGSNRQAINYKSSVVFINNSLKINHNGKTIVSIPIPFTKQPAQNNPPPQANNIALTPTTVPPVNNPQPPSSSSGNWFDNAISSIKGLFGL